MTTAIAYVSCSGMTADQPARPCTLTDPVNVRTAALRSSTSMPSAATARGVPSRDPQPPERRTRSTSYDAVWREFCEALHTAIRVRQVAGSPSRPRSSPGHSNPSVTMRRVYADDFRKASERNAAVLKRAAERGFGS